MSIYTEEEYSRAVALELFTERRRQVNVEHRGPEFDDGYEDGELATAAATYCISGSGRMPPSKLWPWHIKWFKPTSRRRDLVKAGALIIAEIERLDREDALKIGRKIY